MFLGVEKLIGTRIVLSGVTKLTGGTTVVDLPQNLPGVWSDIFYQPEDSPADTTPPVTGDYLVFVSPLSEHHTHVISMDITSGVQNFTISGTQNDLVMWQIVRHSQASVTGFPTHN